jgi:VWFA-related protein
VWHAIRPALLACTLGLWANALAQTPAALPPNQAPPPQAATESVLQNGSVRLLAVSDQGAPVTDLKQEDLRVRVNKEERKIVSLSSTASAPKTIGLFFDISGSRRRDPLVPNELAATANFLKSVWHEHDAGFVISFSDQAWTEASPTSDLSLVMAGLHKIPAVMGRGSTGLRDALCSVQSVGLQSGRGERAFLVVSDFGDNSSRHTEEETIERMQSEGVRVFPLLLQTDPEMPQEMRRSRKSAEKTAERTGGDVLVVEKEKDLSPAFVRLANELRGAYELTYELAPSTGKEKRVQIETTRKNVRLYFARD